MRTQTTMFSTAFHYTIVKLQPYRYCQCTVHFHYTHLSILISSHVWLQCLHIQFFTMQLHNKDQTHLYSNLANSETGLRPE